MANKVFTIEVSGRGTFPYDMLRYGSCWPADTEAARHMEPDAKERRTLTLNVYGNAAGLIGICERFRSFLWSAEIIKI